MSHLSPPLPSSLPLCQWCQGPTGSGKTAWLIDHLVQWLQAAGPDTLGQGQALLVFAANGDNRLRLHDRLTPRVAGPVTALTTTPAAFMQAEVTLFWPLLVPYLGPLPQFPVQLRPENEQELATRFWQHIWPQGLPPIQGWLEAQTIRRSLDFLQLAAFAGMVAEDLVERLPQGMPAGFADTATWKATAEALVGWRDWCLSQSLLTYGVMGELYGRHLLPLPQYQHHLMARFAGVWVDDLDEYPAITARWLQVFIDQHRPVALTWNPNGKVRLGVGADPDYLEQLKYQCQIVDQPTHLTHSLADTWADPVVEWVTNPLASLTVAADFDCFQSIQTTSRGELLRQTAATIGTAIARGEVKPGDVAIISPGLDELARYSLIEILSRQGLAVASLSDQRPLITSPLVRALLTLTAFVYPDLGKLVSPAAVVEMLVVLSQRRPTPEPGPWVETVAIDPARAGLLVDYCFEPRLSQPELLPVESFERWDRLGYRATQAYSQLRQWISQQRQQWQQRLIPNPVSFLDRAIQYFYSGGYHLAADQLTALRELMETAQHYWLVENRLRQRPWPQLGVDGHQTEVERFIHLLNQGTVTANPFPADPVNGAYQGITIATVFQYRLQRLRHRWQFWLDAGSARWLTGTDNLFGFQLFLDSYGGEPWRTDQVEALHRDRLERILRDLLGRTTERVILCHSDLAVTGEEQLGPLLPLVVAASQNSPYQSDSR
ncbi:MAG: hypothetical protein KGQ93_01730 [Cyanobacteria bacterium REEB459]|nr:hypothetical protein [Cyanobacteria bacterium REEB459]